MKRLVLITITFACHILDANAGYSPTQIEELVKAGKAQRAGAQFANQGLGCVTFLWKESEEHHVFFFLRNGHSYGEYREEALEEGRFLSITENYLVAEIRLSKDLKKQTDLKYIHRYEKLERRDNVWVASDIVWSFMERGRNGDLARIGESRSQRIVRGVVSIIFPDDFTPNGRLFDVRLNRANLIPEEVAFGGINPTIETFGITNRRCSIWALWPSDNPELLIILNEKVERVPEDSSPEPYRLREVARMSISLEIPRNTPFIFDPTGKNK